jgi:type IV pilus assembly protein PilV
MSTNMKRQQQGIMLLEAMLAVLLLGIGLVGAILIQARSVGALSDATMRAEATMASESLVALMSNDLPNVTLYALANGGTPSTRLAPWIAETRRAIPGANVIVTVAPLPANTTYRRVDITVQWTRNAGEAQNQHLLTAHLAGSQ